jgi:type IV pilus assembly PilX-like protein
MSVLRTPKLAAERGIVLVVALMTMMFVMALGAAIVVVVSSEALMAAAYRSSQQALAAAEAAAALFLAGDDGFVDGAPGVRTLADGSTIDLVAVVSAADGEGPAPHPGEWQLVAYGPLDDRLPPDGDAAGFYVAVMITDDPGSADPGVVVVRAEAFGARGAHRIVQLTVDGGASPRRVLRWQQSQ